MICLSKRVVVFVSIFVILLASFLYITRKTLNTKISKNTKAEIHKIIGGESVVDLNEFPAVANILTETEEGPQTCTGTLIHPHWILTAAHCLEGAQKIWVAVGIIDLSEFNKRAVRSYFIVKHNKYVGNSSIDNTSGTNDIGLIYLEKEITNVSLPKLPQFSKRDLISGSGDTYMYEKGNIVTAVGWGCIATEIDPTPLYSLDMYWKICSQLSTEKECEKSGYRIGCVYRKDCNLCIPHQMDQSEYSTEICQLMENKIAVTKNIVPVPIEVLPTTIPYGADFNYIARSPDKLQKSDMPIYSASSYLKKEFSVGYDLEKSLEHTICMGDSGGPTFYNKNGTLYLIGINVRSGRGFFAEPYKATNVMTYLNWINMVIEKYTPTPTIAPINR